MVKVVENGERICTVTLDGSESSVVFQNDYKYFAVKNESDADVYVSLNRDIVEGADGVMTIGSKESALFAHMKPNVNMFFVKGKGKIQVFASSNAINPFKSAPASDGGGVQASGNPVQINGLQGGVPFSEITVRGKNLLILSKSTLTANGITATANDDGSITLSGTATAITYIGMWDFLYARNMGIGKIAVNAIDGQSISTYFMGIDRREGGSYIDRIAESITNNGIGEITQEDVENDRYLFVWVRIAAGYTCDNLIIYPQLELGSTHTEYEPPITGRDLTVNVSGKNLIPYPYNRASGTYNGIELIVHDDGRFDISGTATASFAILVFANGRIPIYLSGGQTYTISCNTPYDFSKFNLSARIYRADGNYTAITKFPTTFVAKEGDYLTSALWVNSDVSVSAKNVELQLEYGDTATPYEPYHGSTTTITPDSNPYVIPNDIRQVDGYNVVSVSEGEISVTGVQKNAAIKRIWDDMSMDLLFDGVTSANNPAVIDLANYNMIRIDVGGNYEGTSYFNCGSTYFSKSTLDFAVTSYGYVAIPLSNQAVIISISKSGTEYSLSFSGFNEKQLVDVIKIYGIK